MKVLFFFFSIYLSSHAFSQGCQEVFFTDSTEIKLLEQYISSKKFEATINSLGGVFVLYRFVNQGDKCWRLTYFRDDKCLDECPTRYAYYDNRHIILIHDADEESKPLHNPNCQQSKACIEEVVQGWLYIHPRKDKWIVYPDLDNKPKRVNLSKIPSSRDDFTTQIFRLKKDGTVVSF